MESLSAIERCYLYVTEGLGLTYVIAQELRALDSGSQLGDKTAAMMIERLKIFRTEGARGLEDLEHHSTLIKGRGQDLIKSVQAILKKLDGEISSFEEKFGQKEESKAKV